MMQEENLNGIYYRVNEFKPNRDTIVFVHGLSGSSSAWLHYEENYANDFNVLTYDLRGHGKSIKPPKYSDYEIKNFSKDLFDLTSHLSIRNFVLISHSFGTLVAFEFLKEHQNLVKKTVFLSPSANVKQRFMARIIQPIFEISRILGIFRFSTKPRGHVDYSYYIGTGDWNIRRMIADIKNTSWHVYLYCTLQTYYVNYEKNLKDIKIPILLVHGEKDSIFPVSASLYIKNAINQAHLVLIPIADHILVLNYFEEVKSAITNFLNNSN